MQVMTRKQFKEYWNNILPGLGEENSHIWFPEKKLETPCVAFVHNKNNDSEEFDERYRIHLRGEVKVFASSLGGRWWGFTDEKDAVYTALRWS